MSSPSRPFKPAFKARFSTLITLLALLLWAGTAQSARLEIDMEPSNEAVEDNIRAYIGSLGDRDEVELRRFARHARDQARSATRALGYYDASIGYRVRAGDPPTLRLEVRLGDPVRIRTVDIRVEGEAADMDAFQLPDELRLREGDPLRHDRYETIKRFYRNQGLQYGFFDGRLTSSRLRVDREENAADIEVVYESGTRYRLGDVAFPDDVFFRQSLLERFVRFEPDTPYHSRHVVQLNRDLRQSNYFETIAVNADPRQAEVERIPVDVELEERRPHSINTGIGYSTDVGPRFRSTWTQHYVNDRGHRRGAELEVSEPVQNIGAYYEIPLTPPMTDALRFTGSYKTEEIQDTDSERFSLGVQWRKQLDSGWQQIVSLHRDQDRFRAGEADRRRTDLLLPGLSYSKLVSDVPNNPNRGYRLEIKGVGSHREAFSDVDILNVTTRARGLITVRGGHRFLGRAEAGAVGTNDFDLVPPSLRFFTGGDQTVRGYGFQQLTAKDDDGNRVGGRFMVATSAEYQYPLSDSWRLATFVDHGNAFDNLGGDHIKTGVGVGIRWISPVGPIRLDVARALNSPESYRLHFTMGPEL